MNFDPIQKSYTFKMTDFTGLLRAAIIRDEQEKGYIFEVMHDNPNGTVVMHFTNKDFMQEVHNKEQKELRKRAFLD